MVFVITGGWTGQEKRSMRPVTSETMLTPTSTYWVSHSRQVKSVQPIKQDTDYSHHTARYLHFEKKLEIFSARM